MPKPAHPPLPPLVSLCLPKGNVQGEENWLEAEGRGKKREGGWWMHGEEKKEGAEVYSVQHGLLNWFQSSSWTPGMHDTHCRLAVFAFAGWRKSDLHRRGQPTSHIPPITTTKNERSCERSRPQNRYHRYFGNKNNKHEIQEWKGAYFSKTLNAYIIPHEPSLLQTGSHMSVEGRKTCWVPGEHKAEGSLNRFNWARPNTAMQASPDEATGKSSSPRRPEALWPSVCLSAAAVWLIWYTHSLRCALLTHGCVHGSCAKLPITVVYLKNMLIQQSDDWFVAQGEKKKISLSKVGIVCFCVPACTCVLACISAFVCAPRPLQQPPSQPSHRGLWHRLQQTVKCRSPWWQNWNIYHITSTR